MEQYKIHETIGDGSFGVVFRASNIKTGELVAIKKIKKKFNSWDECMSLRELKSLRKLKEHDNIVKLKEVLKIKDELHFIFEYMEQNIFQLYSMMSDSGKPFTENHVRTVIYHVASALAYMHKHGFFHRDLKPENLLVSKGVTKIADFGLAREIRSRPPFTDYVATRWYRAPEIILKAPNYNSPVDVFALGCTMAELYMKGPLFKGNSEMEQMYKICSILGSPTSSTWNEGLRLAAQIGFTFPQLPGVNLATVIPNASEDAIQLMTEMLRFDPQKRPSAEKILQHPYFSGFSPTDNPFLSQGTNLNIPSLNKQGLSLSRGSDDPQQQQHLSGRRKISNEYAQKNVAADDDDDHREILEELGINVDGLGLESTYGKESPEKDYGNKKFEKWPAPTAEKNPSETDNTDALIAEIEEYVNATANKEPRFSTFENSYNPLPPSNASVYQYQKPTLTGTQSAASNMKPPIGAGRSSYIAADSTYAAKNEWNDGLLGPSSYDIMTKNPGSLTRNKSNGYLNAQSTTTTTDNDTYKYGNQPSQQNQWAGNTQGGMSNRGAQIMNTFVSYNKPGNSIGFQAGTNQAGGVKTKELGNMSYGQSIEDEIENLGKFGY